MAAMHCLDDIAVLTDEVLSMVYGCPYLATTLHGSSATSKTRFIDGSSYLEADCITCFKSFLNQSGSSSSLLLSPSMPDFVIPGFFYEQGIIEFIILQLPLRGVKLSSARQFQIGHLISVGAP